LEELDEIFTAKSPRKASTRKMAIVLDSEMTVIEAV
jgi:hypothetical protein